MCGNGVCHIHISRLTFKTVSKDVDDDVTNLRQSIKLTSFTVISQKVTHFLLTGRTAKYVGSFLKLQNIKPGLKYEKL